MKVSLLYCHYFQNIPFESKVSWAQIVMINPQQYRNGGYFPDKLAVLFLSLCI